VSSEYIGETPIEAIDNIIGDARVNGHRRASP